jgi:hypothetical protein
MLVEDDDPEMWVFVDRWPFAEVLAVVSELTRELGDEGTAELHGNVLRVSCPPRHMGKAEKVVGYIIRDHAIDEMRKISGLCVEK